MKTIEIHGEITVPNSLSHEEFIQSFAYFLAEHGYTFVGTTDKREPEAPINLDYIQEQLTVFER